MEVKVTPTIFKIVNIVACALIILATILRYIVRDRSKEGIDGCPWMIFFIQTILTVMHALFIVCGEIMAPMSLIA